MLTTMTPIDALTHSSLDRVRYFPRQLITADDMRAEQEYFREKMRRHNRYLHGWGVVCGCYVTAASDDHPWQVKIEAGYVLSPNGDEICIPGDVTYDLASNWYQRQDPCANSTPCPPTNRTTATGESRTVYLAICYAECDSRPVRVHPAGCGCDDSACEYSRIRESYELTVLDELPESYNEAVSAEKSWVTWAASNPRPTRLPACSVGHDDCVVLARITLPNSRNTRLTDKDNIAFDERRVVLSNPALEAVLEAGTATPGSTTPGTTPAGGNGTGSNSGTPSDTTGGAVDIPEIDVPPLEEDNPIPDPTPVEVVAVELDAVPLELSVSEPIREGVFNARIALNGPAPEGGTIVTLTSANSKLIDVRLPSRIMIPAGQSEKTFEVKVKPSAAAKRKQGEINLTIHATLGNQIKSAHLRGIVRK